MPSDKSSPKKHKGDTGHSHTKPIKSSSEILDELFGTFNTSFNESEVVDDFSPPRTPRKGKKSKKSKKEKETKEVSKKKKSQQTKRSKSREKEISTPHEKSKHRHKSGSKKRRKSKSSSPVPASKDDPDTTGLPLPESKNQAATQGLSDDATQSVSKYPTIQFRGKTIVLDVEEGEITEEAERKAERKKHLRKRESTDELKDSKKRRHKSSSKAIGEDERTSPSSKKIKKSKRRDSDDENDRRKSDSSRTTGRSSAPYQRSRSRSLERIRRPESRRDMSSYQACHWERARDRSPDKSYYYNNTSRRSSTYDYDWQHYNGGRGGFGYSGKSLRLEDDYYDYRSDRNSRRRSFTRSRSRSRSHGRRRSRSRSRSNDRSSSRSSRSFRSRSRLRRLHPDDIIDKSVLLEIARKNAAKLMRSGVLPTDIFSRDQILAIKAGGKSVEELTEYCKRVAKRDAAGDANDSSDDEPINHPFTVKERPMPGITMNIRNAIPLQIRTPHELAIENAKLKIIFPVSSGTQHRCKELEWKPVDKDEEEKKKKKEKKEDLSKALLPVGTVLPLVQEENLKDSSRQITLEPKPSTAIDIGAVISRRLRAVKDLEENPDNAEAKERFEEASNEMKQWAEAKALEPKFLTPAELLLGPQAWVKKDQLKTAQALQGGMGMHLLQRMGWNPGEGLGKNKEGSTEPLALDIKMDKKGLASTSEVKGPSLPTVFDLTGKHPVSSLMELCAKRHWGDPIFELILEYGPSHKPQFVYKVTVNGVEYQPCVASKAKKEAKHNAAAFCLQSLGLLPIPKTVGPKVKELLKTVPDPPSAVKEDTKLMPPPPPPAALQRLLEFPLPPQLMTNVSTAAGGAAPLTRPLMGITDCELPPPSFNKFMGQKVKNPAAGRLGSRLMAMAGLAPSVDSYNQVAAPIVQVPLPQSSSTQGFPGLTTF